MCGIVGKFNLDSQQRIDRAEIESMMRPARHRGPDGQGVYIDGPLGLGHLRLSIIDVDGGRQPMTNEDDSIWIVFNGEIYNFLALRESLQGRGHVFRTRSDTEVILHLYEEYGLQCVSLLRGMFAFAIWDRAKSRLFVARDRVGIKPLYYTRTDTALLFASELKSLVVDPSVSRTINKMAMRLFLSFGYVPGAETLLKSVYKLLPGHFVVAEPGGFEVQQYWDLKFTDERRGRSITEVSDELHTLLGSTVRDHMISDVPVGVLLSGGVDSTAILSLAVKASTTGLHAFTVGFNGPGIIDERPYARIAADRYGVVHHEVTITESDFWTFLPSYVWHMEEPVCEPPAVALHFVSKLASGYVKVLLSGEGGDEAFAGYPNYPNMLLLERLKNLLGPIAKPAGTAAILAGSFLGMERLRRYGTAIGKPIADHYFSRSSAPTSYFNDHSSRIFSRDLLHSTAAHSPSQTMSSIFSHVSEAPLLDQMLYADTKTWLPDDLLIKADKITMANSLELRVPFLDHVILEFAASLHPDHKVFGFQTKRVLKAAVARSLPPEIINRTKAGFPVPYYQWLQRGASQIRDILLSDRARARGYFQENEIERLVSHQQQTGYGSECVFSLIVLELWHQQFAD